MPCVYVRTNIVLAPENGGAPPLTDEQVEAVQLVKETASKKDGPSVGFVGGWAAQGRLGARLPRSSMIVVVKALWLWKPLALRRIELAWELPIDGVVGFSDDRSAGLDYRHLETHVVKNRINGRSFDAVRPLNRLPQHCSIAD